VLSACTALGGPRAEIVGATTSDLGKYPAHEEKTVRFALRNSGDEELVLRKARTTCGCFRIPDHKTRFAPDESGELIVEVIPDSVHHSFRKYVFLETNDRANRVVRLTIKGDAVPTVGVKPHPRASMGELKAGEKWERVFVLSPNEKEVEFGKLRIESSHPAQARVEEAGDEDSGEHRLVVWGEVAPEPDVLQCEVSVPIAKPQGCRDVVIRLRATVGQTTK